MIIVYFCRNVEISILVHFFVFQTLFLLQMTGHHFLPNPLFVFFFKIYAYLSGIHIARDLKTFYMADLGTWGKLGHFFFFHPAAIVYFRVQILQLLRCLCCTASGHTLPYAFIACCSIALAFPAPSSAYIRDKVQSHGM